MYFIVNTTKQSIAIADLPKLILGPQQGTDLDARYTREVINKSKWLRQLIAKGYIKIKNKTEIEQTQKLVIEQHQHNSEINVDAMKKELMEGMKEVITDSLKQSEPAPQVAPDMALLAKMIADIMKQSGQMPQNISKSAIGDEEIQVDDITLVDIHSRTVEKLTKDAQSSGLKLNKQKSDNDLDDKVDELADLL